MVSTNDQLGNKQQMEKLGEQFWRTISIDYMHEFRNQRRSLKTTYSEQLHEAFAISTKYYWAFAFVKESNK